jgi:hypothetical protein
VTDFHALNISDGIKRSRRQYTNVKSQIGGPWTSVGTRGLGDRKSGC